MAHVVRIAYKTIYNWIDQGLMDINVTGLPDHGIRRKQAKETRGTFSQGRSSKDRPAEILIVILQVTSNLIQFCL